MSFLPRVGDVGLPGEHRAGSLCFLLLHLQGPGALGSRLGVCLPSSVISPAPGGPSVGERQRALGLAGSSALCGGSRELQRPEAPKSPEHSAPKQVCTRCAPRSICNSRNRTAEQQRRTQVDRLIHTLRPGTRPPRRVQGRTRCSVQVHSGGLSESCVSGEVCPYKTSGRFFPAGAGGAPGRCSPRVGLSLQQEEAEFGSSI